MLDIALKEWSIVCDLMLGGRLALLLRKGGIHESGGPGVFELEHKRFVLYPSWEHQRPEMIKPEFSDRVELLEEPKEIMFKGTGEVAKIWQIMNRERFDELEDLHCWLPAQIDMRFDYKPERPLYLIAVRVSRLREEKVVANHIDYGGCRSWVPLRSEDVVDDAGATPVLGDTAFGHVIARVDEALK